MSDAADDAHDGAELPHGMRGAKHIRSALSAVGGAIPFAGGLLSAIAGEWAENEQERVNAFLHHYLRMMDDAMREQQQTATEIAQRLDLHDEEIANRVSSAEYQSIMRKGFREWAAAESENKRILVRYVLSNAACTTITSDDVVRLFPDWIKTYSDLHFGVIRVIYNRNGITRGQIWDGLGRQSVREDFADADLFKLLIRDLNIGGLIRQHREVDYTGNFVRAAPQRRSSNTPRSTQMKSAFDNEDGYELTQLGQQFVHYAMTDLPTKLEFHPAEKAEATGD